MSVYARFAERDKRAEQYPMSPAMRAANADGRLFSSPEVFAARAFELFPRDKHIAPQGGLGAELADLIAPIERSDEAWTRLRGHVAGLPLLVPHTNAGPPQRAVVPRSVQEFYADDIALWAKVSSDFETVRERV